MPYNSPADVCRLKAVWYATKSNVKFDGFQSQLEVSYVFNHTEELRHNEQSVSYIYIYIYIYIYVLNSTIVNNSVIFIYVLFYVD